MTTKAVLQRKPQPGATFRPLPAIRETLAESGQPLPSALRASAEARLGHDFGRVRIHAGPEAARSATAVQAAAYTVGNDVVFGAGRFAPETPAGERLLVHELAHVVQQGGPATRPATLAVEPHHSPAEREADRVTDAVLSGRPAPRIEQRPAAPAVQRSWLGDAIGGVLGAVGGALLGFAMGGVAGAIVGGIAGAVGGVMLGDKLTEQSRSLTDDEKDFARDIFRDTVDYSKITITRDSVYSLGAPRTIGNTIYLKSDWGHFDGDTLDLTEAGKTVLIHEMSHVWQYQNGGLAYIPSSLLSQLAGTLKGRGAKSAYYWREAHAAGLPWHKWNAEQQAQAIEDYNGLLRKSKANDPTLTVEEVAELALLTGYMDNVWKRLGAPGSSTR
jgi:uncharacterized protein YcfJ